MSQASMSAVPLPSNRTFGWTFAAIFTRVQQMVFGEATLKRLPESPALLPVFTHLAIVLMLGLYIPPYLAEWFRLAAKLIG